MKKRLCVLLAICMLILSMPSTASAEGAYAVQVWVDGQYMGPVRTYDGSYIGNSYLSLTDLAAVLSGSAKQFRFERVISTTDGEYFNILRGQSAALAADAGGLSGEATVSSLSPYRNRLLVDGKERRYYTVNLYNGDLYMSMTDVQLMLDMNLTRSEAGIAIDTGTPFLPDLRELEQEGYLEMMDAVFLADADSGILFCHHNSNVTLPVASLSKLLSYLVLKEAIDAGEIGENDQVRISTNAQALSRSGDGMVTLNAGSAVPFNELLQAMLIASSNECALALAEHLSGSEAVFVERMNARARELGLLTTEMYNCNGLPSYAGDSVPVKRQNCMSAADLFRLTEVILEKYPEITEITSMTFGHFPSLNDYRTANSNPLVFNMEGITGLKTGSTNRAGYCLVATMPVEKNGETHTVILVILGAETADIRGQAAEILLRYARSRY